MAYTVTLEAEAASLQSNIEPQLVLEIEGVTDVYGSRVISKTLEFGDPVLFGDAGLIFGGSIAVQDQGDYMSMSSGATTTTITQNLKQDRKGSDSISTMNITLIDKNNEITNLITPGQALTEILGTRCKVRLGFDGTSYPDDFIVVFRGNISAISSGAGFVTFKINHPDDKKRATIFPKATTDLSAQLTAGATVANVTDQSDFFTPYTGTPTGVADTDIEYYIRIEDEIIKYTGSTTGQLTGLTRAQFGTTDATHASGSDVESFVRLTGTALDGLALKLLLSGKNGPYQADVQPQHFVRISTTETVSNTIFFSNLDVESEYNVIIGDYVTTTGASNAANNVTLKQITGITQTDLGSYITVTGVTFVEENDTAALVDFRSQYDVWGENRGLAMHNDEVDIAEWLRINDNFFSSQEYDFYIKDTLEDVRAFIAEQILRPIGCFPIPRKSQVSLGVHLPPLPDTTIPILNTSNIKDVSKIKLERSINDRFFNSVLYKYDESALDDKFFRGLTTIDGTSKTRFGDDVGNKTLVIEAKGMRTSLGADDDASVYTSRILNKYKYGAENFKIKVNFKTGWVIEIGDIVLIEISALQLSDIQSGTRSGESRLFQVENKSLNVKTGEIELTVTDTNFDKTARYGLISPSSKIKSGTSTTVFDIKESYNSRHGVNEYKKWERFIGVGVVVRSADYSVSDTSTIASISANTITLSSALSFTPSADYIMELDVYDNNIDNTKLLYVFMRDSAFSDSKPQYKML